MFDKFLRNNQSSCYGGFTTENEETSDFIVGNITWELWIIETHVAEFHTQLLSLVTPVSTQKTECIIQSMAGTSLWLETMKKMQKVFLKYSRLFWKYQIDLYPEQWLHWSTNTSNYYWIHSVQFQPKGSVYCGSDHWIPSNGSASTHSINNYVKDNLESDNHSQISCKSL